MATENVFNFFNFKIFISGKKKQINLTAAGALNFVIFISSYRAIIDH
jgi:hypothetical protein